MFFSFFISCLSFSTPSIEPSSRMEYILDKEWSYRSWEMKTDPMGQSIHMEATIHLDPSLPLEGSGLRISGLWWKGTLRINDQVLPTFYGGNQDVEVQVGSYLNPGENYFSLTFEAPQNTSSRVTGGTPSSITREKPSADLFFAPTLILRPKNHITGMAIPMQDGKITPIVWSSGEEASQVTLYVELDGKILEELGTCPINNGISTCPAQKWTLAAWNIGEPNLYALHGVLKNKEGEILDQMVERVGVRELNWSKKGLSINKEKKQLLSARMVHRRGGEGFYSRLRLFHEAGINTLEVHGEMLRQDWLRITDELGFAVAIVPRCVGRCNNKNGGSSKDQLAFMLLQDQRLLWDIKMHPSVTLFALEGDTNSRWTSKSLWTEYLQQNIHNIPVFGLDLPVRLLKMELRGNEISSQCQPGGCEGAWLVETVIQSKFPPWELLSKEYLKIQTSGAIGGVIPTPRKNVDSKEKENWRESWKAIQSSLGTTPINAKKQRASTRITIQSKPEQIVKIQANGINSVQKKADRNGLSSFEIFYQGTISIECGEVNLQQEIKADQWLQLQHNALNPIINCSL